MPKLNFTAGKSKFTLLPEGTYNLRITDYEQGVSKEKETPQLEVRCKVIGGQYEGTSTTIFYSLSEKAGWKLRNLVEALDIDFESTEAEGEEEGTMNIDLELDDLIGQKFQVDVSHRTHEGKQYMNFLNERPIPVEKTKSETGNGGKTETQSAPAEKPAEGAPAPAETTGGGEEGGERRRRRPVAEG